MISVSNFEFKASDKFPTTGYRGAKFKIEIDDADSYEWSTISEWGTIEQHGVIAFSDIDDKKC